MKTMRRIRRFGQRTATKFQVKREIRRQRAKGLNESIVFLHVPKTSGTSFRKFSTKAAAHGYPLPLRIKHHCKFLLLTSVLPNAKIAIIARDPIERYISAFNSRLRGGRPQNNIPWNDKTAIAFSLFNDPIDWIEGLVSADDWTISAARYVRKNVNLIRYDYEFYFGSVETVHQNASRLIVGTMKDYEDFLRRVLIHCDVEFDDVSQHLKTYHKARRPTSELTEQLDPVARAKLMEYFADEYEIYNALLDLVPKQH